MHSLLSVETRNMMVTGTLKKPPLFKIVPNDWTFTEIFKVPI